MTDEIKHNIHKLNMHDIEKLIISIFGNSEKGELWLNTPINALNHETPIFRLEAGEDVEKVIEILNKIASGEFS
jgi:uncharacterized protein (DUF2384 family)